MTGSGKTTLARTLLLSRPFVVVYDAKGLLAWPGFQRFTVLQQLAESRHSKLIYAPNHRELQDEATKEKFFEWVYNRQNTTLYVDEVYAVTSRGYIPHYYHACLTRGREMGISVFSSTQRPMLIPQVILSESEHYYVFRLQLPQDKKRIREIVNLESSQIENLPKYLFYYGSSDGEIVGPLKLRI